MFLLSSQAVMSCDVLCKRPRHCRLLEIPSTHTQLTWQNGATNKEQHEQAHIRGLEVIAAWQLRLHEPTAITVLQAAAMTQRLNVLSISIFQ